PHRICCYSRVSPPPSSTLYPYTTLFRSSAICAEYGIKFIGATATQIEQMGDKASAKDTIKKAGVPTVPGSDGLVPDVKTGIKLRSEEHTSELQSRENLVCRLLLEKNKKQ